MFQLDIIIKTLFYGMNHRWPITLIMIADIDVFLNSFTLFLQVIQNSKILYLDNCVIILVVASKLSQFVCLVCVNSEAIPL